MNYNTLTQRCTNICIKLKYYHPSQFHLPLVRRKKIVKLNIVLWIVEKAQLPFVEQKF